MNKYIRKRIAKFVWNFDSLGRCFPNRCATSGKRKKVKNCLLACSAV